jgi:phosphinothricin acetyltransferase
MTPDDWDAVAAIYGAGIEGGNATFETVVPPWAEWDAARLPAPRLVATRAEEVAGWIALTPVSRRAVYRGVVDVGVYVAPSARGRGLGRALVTRMVAESERARIWTLQAGIFPENAASMALFSGCGFRLVGRRERIGEVGGRWRDVLLLERRSEEVS